MVELVDLAWGRENHLSIEFQWRANGGKWCGWPTNTNNQTSSSLWVCPTTMKICSVASSLGVFSCRCDEHAIFYDKLNKMSISNINKHHQKTINSYFRSVWYNEDIIMGLYICFYATLCDIMSIFLCKKCSFILMYLHCVYKLKYAMFLENLNNTTFKTKMSYYAKYDIKIIWHFLVRPNM